MFTSKFEEGFRPVESQKEADRIISDFCFYDTGVDEVIIATEDVPMAIANTPVSFRVRIMRADGSVLATTSGNFVMDCNIADSSEKIAFLDSVSRYQLANEVTVCPFIIEDSEFDPCN